jgi:hypothetical protein
MSSGWAVKQHLRPWSESWRGSPCSPFRHRPTVAKPNNLEPPSSPEGPQPPTLPRPGKRAPADSLCFLSAPHPSRSLAVVSNPSVLATSPMALL